MSESPEDIALRKRQIEEQMAEYAQAIIGFAEFMQDWRYRDGGEVPAEDYSPRLASLIKAGMA